MKKKLENRKIYNETEYIYYILYKLLYICHIAWLILLELCDNCYLNSVFLWKTW